MHPLSKEFWMLAEISPKILIASPDPSLLCTLAPVLQATGARVEGADSGKSALAAMVQPPLPMLALLDGELPQTEIERLIAAAHAATGAHIYPIVLLSDTVAEEWRRRLAEGVLDDIVPRLSANPHWRFRLDFVLRNCSRLRELDRLRERSQMNTQFDSLTGLHNRSALLPTLFRETDRVQRMKTPLSLVLFEIDDFDHWKLQLGDEACDGLLRTVVDRCRHLLRSYDTFGRTGDHEFLMILPGCSSINGTMLAERMRMDVFADPISSDGEPLRLTASFGIASSQGRSPMVVLREAEVALRGARESGPESIQCFVGRPDPQMDPIGFLS
jgi:two-component system cell cycle response regulator